MALNTVWSLTTICLNLSKTSIWNSKGCPNSYTSHTKPLSTPLDVFPNPIPQPLLSHSLGWKKCHPPGDLDKQQSLVWLQSGSSSINKGQIWLFKATWDGQDLTAGGEAVLATLPACVLGTVEVWGAPPVVTRPVCPVPPCAFPGLSLAWKPSVILASSPKHGDLHLIGDYKRPSSI